MSPSRSSGSRGRFAACALCATLLVPGTALAALVKQDIIMKVGPRYVVSDSLYREWVARKTF